MKRIILIALFSGLLAFGFRITGDMWSLQGSARPGDKTPPGHAYGKTKYPDPPVSNRNGRLNPRPSKPPVHPKPSIDPFPTLDFTVSAAALPTADDPAGSNVANKAVKAGTIITLIPPLEISLGETFTLSGSIKDWSGVPIVDESISFNINGSYLGQTRSDEKGNFLDTFNRPFDAGIYAITANFNGTHDLSYASAATTLQVQPADVTVQTIPAVSGVTFQLNNSQFVTGDDGSATIKVNKAGVYRLEVLTDEYSDPSQRIEFGRWLEDNYQPYKDITVPVIGVIQAGLNIFNLVSQAFIGLDGQPLDPARISEFTIRNQAGDSFVFNNGDPRWIPASRIAHRPLGLVQTKLLYSVISVKVDGSNVVNASQQQFYAEQNDNWKISLLLYSLTVKVNDGLFGSATGNSINLVYPNGEVKNYLLDKTGSVQIHGLARGNYSVEAVGAKGLGNKMPVALSRNQDANMKVLTYMDIGIMGFLGFLVALALFLFGRRQVLIKMIRTQQQLEPSRQGSLLEVDEILPADGNSAPPKDEVVKWS
jgi:hypothetical protein